MTQKINDREKVNFVPTSNTDSKLIIGAIDLKPTPVKGASIFRVGAYYVADWQKPVSDSE